MKNKELRKAKSNLVAALRILRCRIKDSEQNRARFTDTEIFEYFFKTALSEIQHDAQRKNEN